MIIPVFCFGLADSATMQTLTLFIGLSWYFTFQAVSQTWCDIIPKIFLFHRSCSKPASVDTWTSVFNPVHVQHLVFHVYLPPNTVLQLCFAAWLCCSATYPLDCTACLAVWQMVKCRGRAVPVFLSLPIISYSSAVRWIRHMPHVSIIQVVQCTDKWIFCCCWHVLKANKCPRLPILVCCCQQHVVRSTYCSKLHCTHYLHSAIAAVGLALAGDGTIPRFNPYDNL